MTSRDDLLSAIAAAPEGPDVIAFFDYDGTLIDGYSAGAFYRHRIRNRELGVPELARTLLAGHRGIHSDSDFEQFLELSLSAWVGREEAELVRLGDSLFVDDTASRVRPEVWELAIAHRRRGHRVVLASSGTRFQVEPMARELGTDEILCTELESKKGLLTGKVRGTPLWADRKAAAAKDLAARTGADLAAAFAYSNGAEDVPLLAMAGNPVAVAPTDAMRAEAEQRGWPVLECSSRGGLLPSIDDVARTVAFYGGMAGAFGTALGIGLLRRSRTQVRDLTCSIGADVGFSLAGIDVNVEGAEHLVSARPCVFVINHQSKLDVPVVMKLLRGGFTGVAKKEASAIPLWGQIFKAADVAFVDRTDSVAARASLEPAVKRLKEDGVSLAMSAEGTRSPTPRLGQFKKGAFHIAMQAKVPIVPIVIRNAGEVMWRGAQTLRSGTIDVRVLPPVDTKKWTVKTIDKHVAEVRGMFVDTLENWRGLE